MSPKLESTQCPVCSQAVVISMINQHLDRCVGNGESPRSKKRKRVETAASQEISSASQNGQKSTGTHSFFAPRIRPKAGSSTSTTVKNIDEEPEIVDLDDDHNPKKNGKCPEDAECTIIGSIQSKPKVNDDLYKPLAEIMRPSSLEDYVGQEDAIGERTLLRKLINSKNMPSIILWGPPGCGKTTLAHIISKKSREQGSKFVALSAVAAGTKDVKDVVQKAQTDQKMFKSKTILFLDEIHRFNKSQQDVFLPHVEKGTITLVGATTENPSFSLNSALLSRCKVIVLEKLSTDNIKTILERTLRKLNVSLHDEESPSQAANEKLSITKSAVDFLVAVSDGDCRTALNSLQSAVHGFTEETGHCITKDDIKSSLKKTHFLYDRKGDNHYDTISAFHKSMRFGKENAALYYLARMLSGGEDPRFIARRLMVFASEDIGVADSSMLSLAVSTQMACEKIGMPECRIQLSHCAVAFARAPKSRETYDAYGRAEIFVKNYEGSHPGIPLAIRNAPTKLMKDLGYAQGEYGSCMPEGLENLDFFQGPPPAHHKCS